MKLSQIFSGKYFKAADIQTQLLVTISGMQLERMPGRYGQMETKPVLYFQGQECGLVLNQTNANTLAEMFGSEETNHWVGQRCILYTTKVEFGGQMTDGIRVKAAPGPQQQQQPGQYSQAGPPQHMAEPGPQPSQQPQQFSQGTPQQHMAAPGPQPGPGPSQNGQQHLSAPGQGQGQQSEFHNPDSPPADLFPPPHGG